MFTGGPAAHKIKLPESYSIALLRQQVTESMRWHGEQAILLQAYHPGDADAVPCVCRDDTYGQAPAGCASCYGISFQGGVRQAIKVWSIFSDTRKPESYTQRGTWQLDQREVQIEAFPLIVEHDFLVRVGSWDEQGRPADVYGFYAVQSVVRDSLRTGGRFGQQALDVVGQRVTLTELAPSVPICTYPVQGVLFSSYERSGLSMVPSSTPLPVSAEIASSPMEAEEGYLWLKEIDTVATPTEQFGRAFTAVEPPLPPPIDRPVALIESAPDDCAAPLDASRPLKVGSPETINAAIDAVAPQLTGHSVEAIGMVADGAPRRLAVRIADHCTIPAEGARLAPSVSTDDVSVPVEAVDARVLYREAVGAPTDATSTTALRAGETVAAAVESVTIAFGAGDVASAPVSGSLALTDRRSGDAGVALQDRATEAIAVVGAETSAAPAESVSMRSPTHDACAAAQDATTQQLTVVRSQPVKAPRDAGSYKPPTTADVITAAVDVTVILGSVLYARDSIVTPVDGFGGAMQSAVGSFALAPADDWGTTLSGVAADAVVTGIDGFAAAVTDQTASDELSVPTEGHALEFPQVDAVHVPSDARTTQLDVTGAQTAIVVESGNVMRVALGDSAPAAVDVQVEHLSVAPSSSEVVRVPLDGAVRLWLAVPGSSLAATDGWSIVGVELVGVDHVTAPTEQVESALAAATADFAQLATDVVGNVAGNPHAVTAITAGSTDLNPLSPTDAWPSSATDPAPSTVWLGPHPLTTVVDGAPVDNTTPLPLTEAAASPVDGQPITTVPSIDAVPAPFSAGYLSTDSTEPLAAPVDDFTIDIPFGGDEVAPLSEDLQQDIYGWVTQSGDTPDGITGLALVSSLPTAAPSTIVYVLTGGTLGNVAAPAWQAVPTLTTGVEGVLYLVPGP